MNFCHICKSSDIILDYQAGDLICTGCGLVIGGRIIDESDETRVYSEDFKNKETRSSGMDDKYNGSVLLFRGGEHDKAALERAQRTVVDRIQKNILTFGSLLKELCSKLNINKGIQDEAYTLIERSVTERLVGRSMKDALVGACVYQACRMAGYPRTMDEISAFSGVPCKHLLSLQVTLVKQLNLPISTIGRILPESLVTRIGSLAGITDSVLLLRAKEFCRRISAAELLVEVSSPAVAGCCLALTALLSRVSVDVVAICQAAFSSQQLISSVYHELLPFILHFHRNSRSQLTLPSSCTVAKESGIIPQELLTSFFGKIAVDFRERFPQSFELLLDKAGRTIIIPELLDGNIHSSKSESSAVCSSGQRLVSTHGDDEEDLMRSLEEVLAKDRHGRHSHKSSKSKTNDGKKRKSYDPDDAGQDDRKKRTP
eukprot:gene23618-31984_t